MIIELLIFIIAFLALIALMVIHEFGHFIIAKKFGVHVEEFGIGYPPRIFGKKIGQTLYSINWIPLGAFVKIKGEEGQQVEGGLEDPRSFTNLKIWKRVLIVIGGVVAFWVAAIIIFSVVFAIGTELPVGDQDFQGLKNPQVKITAVAIDSPAGKAGLKAGDVIVKLNNFKTNIQSEITKVSDFQKFVSANQEQLIDLVVRRNNQVINVSLTPRSNPPQGQGAVGIALQRMATLVEKSAWYKAPVKGAFYTWQTTVEAFKGLYVLLLSLFSGHGAPQGAEFAGPIGITVFLANAASYGIGFFLYFIGMICVFVAIFNLFPIPALDGGKLIFLLIEKIKGKPVSPKVEQSITAVFFTILICLSVFVTVRFDIPRFADFIKSSMVK
jgi:regulator of sigma E protease